MVFGSMVFLGIDSCLLASLSPSCALDWCMREVQDVAWVVVIHLGCGGVAVGVGEQGRKRGLEGEREGW
jgi:hypothetical protein